MKICLSMRMERAADTGELRHAVADDWLRFMGIAVPGACLIPVPNGPESARWLDAVKPDGVILSGGADWGTSPERDATEFTLLKIAREQRLPLLAVCRGMQVLNHYLGGRLPSARDVSHVSREHSLEFSQGGDSRLWQVNSYHGWVLHEEDIAPSLDIVGKCGDGSVEAVSSSSGKMYGVMWHPERAGAPRELDLAIMNELFGDRA